MWVLFAAFAQDVAGKSVTEEEIEQCIAEASWVRACARYSKKKETKVGSDSEILLACCNATFIQILLNESISTKHLKSARQTRMGMESLSTTSS